MKMRIYLSFLALLLATALSYSCRNQPVKPENPPAPVNSGPAQPGTNPVQNPSPGPAATGTNPPAPARPARSAPGALVLLYTTAVSGELVDCGCPHHPRGGLARRASYTMGQKKAQPALVNVDGGSAFFPYLGMSAVSEDLKKRAGVVARGMAYMGIDAVNVGSMDLAGGLDFLTNQLAKPEGQTPLPLLSANLALAETHQLVFPASRVVEVGGIKVGIFGVMQPGPATHPKLEVQDPIIAAGKAIADLRGRCDLVIALYDGDFTNASRLAEQVPGADVMVVSDRAGMARPQPMVIKDTLLVQASNRGMYLGRMDLTLTAQATGTMPEAERSDLEGELARLRAQKTILEGQIQADPQFQAEYNKVSAAELALQQRLLAAHTALNYNSSLVSLDLELTEDATVAKWVLDIGVKPKTPTPTPVSPPPRPPGQ